MYWMVLPHEWIRFAVIIMLAVTMYVESLCAEGSRQATVTCLRTYFNDTGQDIPRGLDAILNVDPDRKRRAIISHLDGPGYDRRRRRNARGDPTYSTTKGKLNPEWCGAFRKQLDCYGEVRKSCSPRGPVLVCQVLGSFAQYYGKNICGRDISDWVAMGGKQTCKDKQGVSVASSYSARWHAVAFCIMTILWTQQVS